MRLPVFDRRRAGVLLPLSALERPLGAGGRAFIDWLAEARFSVWQILPLGPTGADGSPYWVRSDRAGNPHFLDPAEGERAQLAALRLQAESFADFASGGPCTGATGADAIAALDAATRAGAAIPALGA